MQDSSNMQAPKVERELELGLVELRLMEKQVKRLAELSDALPSSFEHRTEMGALVSRLEVQTAVLRHWLESSLGKIQP